MKQEIPSEIYVDAGSMQGSSLEYFDSYVGFPVREKISIRSMNPGDRVFFNYNLKIPDNDRLLFNVFGISSPYLNYEAARRLYLSRRPLFLEFSVAVNGLLLPTVQAYYPSHLFCDPFPCWSFHINQQILDTSGIKTGKDVHKIEILFHGALPPFPSDTRYLMREATIRTEKNDAFSASYHPDPLDIAIKNSGERAGEGLKIGIGYEFVLRKDIPDLIHIVERECLGNYLILRLDNALNDGAAADRREILSWITALVKRKIFFSLLVFRVETSPINAALLEEIKKMAGRYFVSVNLHETGSYLRGSSEWWSKFTQCPPENLKIAYRLFVNGVKALSMQYFFNYGDTGFLNFGGAARLPSLAISEPNLLSAWNIAAGADIPIAELYPDHCSPLLAEVRGAARSLCSNTHMRQGQGLFGVHLALLWYFQSAPEYPWDFSLVERFSVSSRVAYLAGARILYPESGVLRRHPVGIREYREKEVRAARLPYNHPVQEKLRDVLRDIRKLHYIWDLPPDPITPIACLKGKYDPFNRKKRGGSVMGNPVISDYEADSGWELVKLLVPGWQVFDDSDESDYSTWLSGSPYGQFDIVPADAAAKRLLRYRFAFIPGWNTMTEDMAAEWAAYCRNGGRLLITASQLRADLKSGEVSLPLDTRKQGLLSSIEWYGDGSVLSDAEGSLPSGHQYSSSFRDKIYRNSDAVTVSQSRKFGGKETAALHFYEVRMDEDAEVLMKDTETGTAVLIRQTIGKGDIFLLNVREYPGNPVFFNFFRDLLADLLKPYREQVSNKTAEKVQVFRYRLKGMHICVYLNTDTGRSARKECIRYKGSKRPFVFTLDPGDLRIVCEKDGLILSPHSYLCAVCIENVSTNNAVFTLSGYGKQYIDIVWEKVADEQSHRYMIRKSAEGVYELELSLQNRQRRIELHR